VKIDLGSHIELPGRTIPIRADGTLLVSPNAGKKARRITLNELALAPLQHSSGEKTGYENIHDEIVLARTPANPLSPPDVFAATLATIQTHAYIHPVSWIFDLVFMVIAVATFGRLRRLSRIDLVIGAIAVTAAYCLIAIALISRARIWLPGCLPLGVIWLLVLIAIVMPHPNKRAQVTTIPPSVP